MRGCYLPYLYLLVSLLLPPVHCLALHFCLILTSTGDPGRLLGPFSRASSAQGWLLGSSPPPHALPKLGQGAICPGGAPHITSLGTVIRPKRFYGHAHVYMGELLGLLLSWHLRSSSHPPCSQPAPKPVSRAGRPQPSPCVVPAGSTGSTHPLPSATAAGGTGSPCTTHLSSGSKPACLHLWGVGLNRRCLSSSSGCTGALWDCAIS